MICVPITKKIQMSKGAMPVNQEVTLDAKGQRVANFTPCMKCGKMNCKCGDDCGCHK